MKIIFKIIKLLWWLTIGYIPIALHALQVKYRELIGCPEKGDCYVQGSELLLNFDVTIISIALILWPVCLWFLGINKIIIFLNK